MDALTNVPKEFESWAAAYAYLRNCVVMLNKVQPPGSSVESHNTLRVLCETVGVTTTEIEEAVRRGKG